MGSRRFRSFSDPETHFAAEDFDTMGYWQRRWWPTTIPYWVELLGTAKIEEDVFEITGEMVVA